MSSKPKLNKTWSPDEVENLITAFQARPILWDCKNTEYKNRVKTNLLHVELSKMFSTTPEEIARKLHNLKGQYNQEVTKLKKRSSDSGNTETYVSCWRYFTALSFLLQGKEHQRNATDTLADPLTAAYEDTCSQQSVESLLSSVSEEQQPSSSQHKILLHPPSKKRKEDTSLINERTQVINRQSDDDQIFADYVASELRKLSKEGNKKLRRIIQRAIINIQDEEDEPEYKHFVSY